jgi:hypothetical protein
MAGAERLQQDFWDTRAQRACPGFLGRSPQDFYRPLAEAEDELCVVGHLLRRPRRIPSQLDFDVVDPGNL